ncbi:MAG: tetraacyldisaccharide 4'-kinase [Acidobacteria bacterium]|nr:tetraacyldisaccharide 4'-kinase [Acidobacteriota bacterium]
MISALYAAVARRRREWYAARPESRRRLRHPVISIGNIAAGGRGKTPFAATVARMLIELGERPAILSRGYARTQPEDGAVVVRDAEAIRADLARSGDEPLMLARQLPGAIVVACADRFLAGRLAEHHLGATVHVLDDGFQHFQLDRDIDIVLVSGDDVAGASTFPRGRLREPPDVLVAADAVVIVDGGELPASHAPSFRAVRRNGPVVFEAATDSSEPGRVFAVAGIANPRRFFDAVAGAGWVIAGERVFPDHHAFSPREVREVFSGALAIDAVAVLTTEKDYVRLLPHRPFPMRVGYLPFTMEPEPREPFRRWLVSSMAAARDIVLA